MGIAQKPLAVMGITCILKPTRHSFFAKVRISTLHTFAQPSSVPLVRNASLCRHVRPPQYLVASPSRAVTEAGSADCGLLLTQHARLPAREGEGGEEEESGSPPGEAPAADAGGAGPAGPRAGGVAAEHEPAGKQNP